MMRMTRDKKRVVMDESDLKNECYIKAYENDHGTVFKLINKEGKIIQTLS